MNAVNSNSLLIISSTEGALGYRKKINMGDNKKIILPLYLDPINKIKIKDEDENNSFLSWKFKKLDDDNIPYSTKKLEIADYIAINNYTKNLVVIKRMEMQEILELWVNNTKNYGVYHGKKGFMNMFRDLRKNFAYNIPIILAIEDYYATFFDTTNNCIWISWNIKESTKLDARNNPLYITTNFKRYAIHPDAFHYSLHELERIYSIHVQKFYNGIGLYSYIVYDLIFNRNEQIKSKIYIYNEKIEMLLTYFPFLQQETAEKLIRTYSSVSQIISFFLSSENETIKMVISENEYNGFLQWKLNIT